MLHEKYDSAADSQEHDHHLARNSRTDPRGLPKKSGCGGAHNWGSFMDDVDYIMSHPNARSLLRGPRTVQTVQTVDEKTFCRMSGKPILPPKELPHFDQPTVVKVQHKRHRQRRHSYPLAAH